jgi:alpha/beta superfamily hydrolase
MEEKIRFLSNGHEIEGRLEKSSLQKGVVITHPHPLYGGDMHNNVVAAIARVYRQHGYTTLRFNFRGVGNSQGGYGDGVGEQEDVRAAISHLADLGIGQIDLAGYSFGAWVNALAATNNLNIKNMVMVSPPVAFVDFGSISDLGSLRLIITGSRDDIAPAEIIKQAYAGWNAEAQFEVINGADHFYMGYLDKLEAILTAFLEGREKGAKGSGLHS